MSAVAAPLHVEANASPPRLLPPDATYGEVTDIVASGMERRFGRVWWIALGVSLVGTIVMLASIWTLLSEGIGVWGNNAIAVWGFDVGNYVWWIGIGNAGTLISSMLLLTRQRWRAAINRYAEAMTLFAAALAGLYPLLHLGRPWYAYWLAPYPNTMDLWPQWRSPLVWDMVAIASYLIFSALFWYTGLIPDFATLRDRSRGFRQVVYGVLALGWQGSSRQWKHYKSFYTAMAALGVPLVVSLHSVVGLDYAATLMPGWQETIFPPYFVVGAMFSGFAMVVTLTVPIRWGLGLQRVITAEHLDAMGKFILFGALVMGLSYALEWFNAWYGGNDVERDLVLFQFTGAHAWLYWTMLACNCAVPQLLWWPAARRSAALLLATSVAVNIGMWLERLLINIDTLTHGHLPARWGFYVPTVWDWTLFGGSLSLFTLLFLLFTRFVPAVSIHELRELARQEGAAR
ncbi:NrfD/PsrC family molybdoenzyme membrane anchor subunit [Mangrovicella endophytica]|uniref:NrfD/PsrC family molybdoenzyme membrane anchor subunit n=1 Tax=Mangrovicella endophytica TaxID=2066697 RepID=UPI000C9DB6C4|nr:NrfD/PsrC family molybdoenzyme membrane anchor subunit [Mangrovicella endophytica]